MKRYFLLIVLLLMTFVACKNDKQQAAPKQITTPSEQVKMVVFPMPTPYEITDILTRSKVTFNQDLLNPISNADKYLSEKAKAVNLGVYGTDLSYTNVFNNSQLTLKYFEVSKKLSDQLGLSALFSKDYLQRIENNIENPDSLYKIATDTYYKTYSYLYNRGKGDIASIVLAGAFVEGLYLAGKSAEQSQNPKLIYDKIAEQRFASEQLVRLLEQNSTSDYAEQMLEEIRPLDALFRQISFSEDKPEYTEDLIKKILETAYQIRQQFINLE